MALELGVEGASFGQQGVRVAGGIDEGLRERGADRTRPDGVAADAAMALLDRQLPGQGVDAALGRGVHERLGKPGERMDAGDVDDRAAAIAEGLDGGGAAGDQPAPADAHQQQVDRPGVLE